MAQMTLNLANIRQNGIKVSKKDSNLVQIGSKLAQMALNMSPK